MDYPVAEAVQRLPDVRMEIVIFLIEKILVVLASDALVLSYAELVRDIAVYPHRVLIKALDESVHRPGVEPVVVKNERQYEGVIAVNPVFHIYPRFSP